MWFSLYVIIDKAIIKTREMIAKAILLIKDKINNFNKTSSNIQITSLSLEIWDDTTFCFPCFLPKLYNFINWKSRQKQTKVLKVFTKIYNYAIII